MLLAVTTVGRIILISELVWRCNLKQVLNYSTVFIYLLSKSVVWLIKGTSILSMRRLLAKILIRSSNLYNVLVSVSLIYLCRIKLFEAHVLVLILHGVFLFCIEILSEILSEPEDKTKPLII